MSARTTSPAGARTLVRTTFADRYDLEALLGRGGMSEVYRAIDGKLRRKVTIEVVRPDREDPDAGKRLLREARAAGSMSHPNAVAIHDFGDSVGTTRS